MGGDQLQSIEDISERGLASTSSLGRSLHLHQRDEIQNSAFYFDQSSLECEWCGTGNGGLGLKCLPLGKSKAAARSRVVMTAFFDSWGYKKVAKIKHFLTRCIYVIGAYDNQLVATYLEIRRRSRL